MTHESDPRTSDTESAEPRSTSGRAPVPQSAAEWRALLREEALPPEIDELRGRQRRKAKKRWHSARRDERAEWIRQERKKTPTPVVVPVIALIVAAAVAGAAWLWPDRDSTAPAKAKPTPTVVTPETPASASPTPTPTAPAVADDPQAVTRAFVTAYTARRPLQDGSHKAAVERAAPYASTALVENLKKHDDRDFNQLVAAQATDATPTKVHIGQPDAKERPAPDTSVRVYLTADVTLDVKGTDPYSYTRHLTIEVARADAASRWMVTRVLGLKE
ncbi:hypothetical protein [Streptomyces marianii]|uniref:hypothetical protein n=1 Tax=Streptomyces marianii TaxID=1817406 RepID=UPI0018F8C265|nr:hypothetical protein [Streptomyces marianii]